MTLGSQLLWLVGVSLGAFVVLTAATAAAAGGSTILSLGLVVGGLLLYWTATERQETESAAETAQRVGENASGLFGGIVDWFSAAVLSIAFVVVTVSSQFFDTIDLLVQMVLTAPVTSGALGLGGLVAVLDWNGTVGLQLDEWIIIGVALTVAAVLVRRALYGEVDV